MKLINKIYNRIYNICKGQPEKGKTTPYSIEVLPNGLYGYCITEQEVVENNLWSYIPQKHLSEIEGL